MNIQKKNFPAILQDNESTYFKYLEGIISARDELSSIQITKNPYSYSFRIATSTPEYSQPLLEDILAFHTFMGIHLVLSKSIRKNSTISFEISI